MATVKVVAGPDGSQILVFETQVTLPADGSVQVCELQSIVLVDSAGNPVDMSVLADIAVTQKKTLAVLMLVAAELLRQKVDSIATMAEIMAAEG